MSFYSCRSDILCNQKPMKQWLTSGCVPPLPFPPLLPSPKDSERVLHLGSFVCLSVCPHRTFVVFFSATTSQIETKFSPLVRLLMQNVLMIITTSSVTWCGSHIGKTEKTLNLYLWNCTKEKIETWHIASTPHGEWVWFLWHHRCPHYDVIIVHMQNATSDQYENLRVIWG